MNRDTVCSPETVRLNLDGISKRKWAEVRHLFPWSYKLGPRKPRIVWRFHSERQDESGTSLHAGTL